MTDLVSRLRNRAKSIPSLLNAELMNEAADMIEKRTKERDGWAKEAFLMRDELQRVQTQGENDGEGKEKTPA